MHRNVCRLTRQPIASKPRGTVRPTARFFSDFDNNERRVAPKLPILPSAPRASPAKARYPYRERAGNKLQSKVHIPATAADSFELPPVDASPLPLPATALPSSPPPPLFDLEQERRKFYLMLRSLITHNPDMSIPHLINAHNSSVHLQSTQSFNLLINYTLQRTARGIARTLFNELMRSGHQPNEYTWKLRVRMLILQGHSRFALKTALEGIPSYPRPDGPIPFGIWAELLRISQPSGPPPPAADSSIWKGLRMESANAARRYARIPPTERFMTLFNPDILPSPERDEDFEPEAFMRIIRFLLIHSEPRQPKLAVSLTESFIRRLPAVLSSKEKSDAIGVINQHFHVHVPRTDREVADSVLNADRPSKETHYAHCARFFELSKLHSQIRPNYRTVELLLGSLRGTKNRGRRAIALMKLFERRWGKEAVTNITVRRIVGTMVLDSGQKYRRIVQKLIEEQDEELARNAAAARYTLRGGQERAKYFTFKARAVRRGMYLPPGRQDDAIK